VNRFIKITSVCVFFAATFAVSLHAQPSSQTNPGHLPVISKTGEAKPGQAAEAAEEKVPAKAPAVFYIGQPPENDRNASAIFAKQIPAQLAMPVTNSMICTWIIAAIILIIVRVTTWKNLKEIPSGMQNALEALVEGWEGLIGDILDPKVARWVFPFATTFFIFIVMSNLVDLIPGVGSIGFGTPDKNSVLPFAIDRVAKPFFRPPTTDANLTVAMAGIFLVMSLFWAVRYNGVFGLVKHIFGVKMDTNKWAYPLFFLLFIFIGAMELLSVTFARPVALAMRLYGNVFAGESILDMTFHNHLLLALVLSTFTYFYETFVCVVQAFVFAMLVVAFVGTLCTHEDEAHAR
jgi:F-type H+-transporting ATPase subunit a